ncbi:hypothetical protein M404DRAFT_941208 [Pisolithus tinctorius Marx 270]|uniref:Uncharacterized protein n=1 Tax=Pisolithus tinctorius Marx 270 TaxID=870435 RepID=A0A0C3JDZ6_PISTI|nr:hypothetical protein M404DRAFT_941208 [Pisolithus tinctorius Marx 270]
MRSCSIYACAVTIRIVICSTFLVFAFHYNFPPLMVLIIALLNNGTVMMPDLWDSEYVWDCTWSLLDSFYVGVSPWFYEIAYSLCLALPSLPLF